MAVTLAEIPADDLFLVIITAHFLAEKGRAIIYGIDGGFSDMASSTGGSSGDRKKPDLAHIATQLKRMPSSASDTRK
jgi:hypothetical protein